MLFLQRKESSPLFRRIRKDSSTQPVSAFVCVGVVGGDEKEMRPCASHLGIVGVAEESALVSRFIRKTNKGKYSPKM